MNYLDSDKKKFVLCDDKSGSMLNISKRVDIVTTLQIVHEVYEIMQKTRQPSISNLEFNFALHALCNHLGWTSHEVAAVEYAALQNQFVGGSAPTTG